MVYNCHFERRDLSPFGGYHRYEKRAFDKLNRHLKESNIMGNSEEARDIFLKSNVA